MEQEDQNRLCHHIFSHGTITVDCFRNYNKRNVIIWNFTWKHVLARVETNIAKYN